MSGVEIARWILLVAFLPLIAVMLILGLGILCVPWYAVYSIWREHGRASAPSSGEPDR